MTTFAASPLGRTDALLSQLFAESVAQIPARRAAAVETLREAFGAVLADATEAKCLADWRQVFESAVSQYEVAIEFFNRSEPVEYRIPVFMTADKRRFDKALAYARSHQYGGDGTAELPAPNGYARVSVERIPPHELIAEHMLALGAFEECFKTLLQPANCLFGTLKTAFVNRAALAELDALIDSLLFFLCGETTVAVEGNRLEVFSWSRRNAVELKIQVLLNILDDSSPFATVQ